MASPFSSTAPAAHSTKNMTNGRHRSQALGFCPQGCIPWEGSFTDSLHGRVLLQTLCIFSRETVRMLNGIQRQRRVDRYQHFSEFHATPFLFAIEENFHLLQHHFQTRPMGMENAR
jgi:hypothetical protein